jgi:putative ABC transport system permease protein
VTAILGVFLDAWDEVRVHRARVVLSLIGIVLAVFAMTSTTAAGMIFKQIVQEQAERFGGRDATITVRVYSGGSATLPEGAVQSFYDSIVRRYGVKYNSESTPSRSSVCTASASTPRSTGWTPTTA